LENHGDRKLNTSNCVLPIGHAIGWRLCENWIQVLLIDRAMAITWKLDTSAANRSRDGDYV